MNNLLVLTPDADDYAALLEQKAISDLKIVYCSRATEAKHHIRYCHLILGDPGMTATVLHEAKRLEWVQSTYAGVEALCLPELRRDYILTGVRNVFGPLMREYVFAYILSLERQVLKTRENQRARSWTMLPYRGLTDLTLGICGIGSIGSAVAQTAAQFGMKVIAYKRTPQTLPDIHRVYTGSSFGEFLSLSDYLVVVLPHTPETTGLFDYQAFCQMKPTAALINVGRGNAVDEKDLIRALREGKIRWAVLDVFDKEPLSEDSALWDLPNAIITPHNSAFSFPRDIVRIFYENYQRFITNRPLQYVIDFERGY